MVRINRNDSIEKQMQRHETERPGAQYKNMTMKMENALNANRSAAVAHSSRSMVSEQKEKAWAEAAKFNQLLDYKIQLDNAEEAKKKVNLQKEYLDVQLRSKQRENAARKQIKNIQQMQMANFVTAYNKEKNDIHQLESVQRVKAHAYRMNEMSSMQNKKKEEEDQDKQQYMHQMKQAIK